MDYLIGLFLASVCVSLFVAGTFLLIVFLLRVIPGPIGRFAKSTGSMSIVAVAGILAFAAMFVDGLL